jgi:malonate transporter and related proteins
MPVIYTSLIAVFLVIAAGWGLKARDIITDVQWAGFERVTYYVLFPAVLVSTISMAKLGDVPFLAVATTLVTCILSVTALLLFMRPWLLRAGIDGPAFTSVFQGSARWNSFVALALAGSLHGQTGIALMAIVVATLIPLLNVLSVLVLSHYAAGPRLSLPATLKALIRNPFIWSSLLGIALNPVSHLLPAALVSALDIAGRAALAAGLLVTGSGLDLKSLARPRLPHALASMLKLVVIPFLAITMGAAMGLTGTPMAIIVIAAAAPTATGAYILARQMGGDAPLMAEITTLQTMLALFTLPLCMALAK